MSIIEWGWHANPKAATRLIIGSTKSTNPLTLVRIAHKPWSLAIGVIGVVNQLRYRSGGPGSNLCWLEDPEGGTSQSSILSSGSPSNLWRIARASSAMAMNRCTCDMYVICIDMHCNVEKDVHIRYDMSIIFVYHFYGTWRTLVTVYYIYVFFSLIFIHHYYYIYWCCFFTITIVTIIVFAIITIYLYFKKATVGPIQLDPLNQHGARRTGSFIISCSEMEPLSSSSSFLGPLRQEVVISPLHWAITTTSTKWYEVDISQLSYV